MHGLSINGFIIVETMGSGRFGNLYLARHPVTGQEAIIRLVSEGENGSTMQVFLDEASSLLPGSHEVRRAPMSDGREALVALPSAPNLRAQTLSTGQPTPAPGSGRSQYANTQRLERTQSSRANASLVVLLVGVACLGAGGAALWLAYRAPVALPVAPVSAITARPQEIPVPLERPVALPSVTPPPVEVPAVADASAAPMVDSNAPVPAPPTKAPVGKRPANPKIVCEASPEWKKLMMGNLAMLEAQADALPALALATEAESVGQAVAEARTPKDCARAIAKFESLRKRAIKGLDVSISE